MAIFTIAKADPYLPSTSGEIVIEAEHYDANTASGSTAWVQVQTQGYVGDGAMQASPDSGIYIGVLSESNSPRLDFQVEYSEPVFLNAWVRGLGPDWSGDSIRIGVDGDISTAILMETVPKGEFAWERFRRQLFLPAGVHTISVWMREDGPIIDRLFLTPSSVTPIGDGAAESARADAGQDSPDNTWPVAQDDTFDIVNDGTSHELSVLADNGNGVDFDPDGDAVNVVSVEDAETADASVAVNASSDGLIYTPSDGQTGTDRFDYTISDGNGGTGTATVTVRVSADDSSDDGSNDDDETDSGNTGDSGAYQPDGSGQVVIEVENFDANVSRGGLEWEPEYRSGYVGRSAMHPVPNRNVRIESNIAVNSPRLDYRVDYSARRTVNVWVRSFGLNGSSDSVWVGIDGDSENAIRINAPNRAWGWRSSSQQFTIPAGEHTVNIWMREDGTVVDRLLLTPSSARPSGDGPGESSRNGSGEESPDNTWPIARDDVFDLVNDGTRHLLSVLADNGSGVDFDADGDTVSVIAVEESGSAGGSVSVSTSSSELAYTPVAGQTGTDSFDYTISDGNGGTDSATVTVRLIADVSNDDDSNDTGGSVYRPDGNGQVVIEAENYAANVSLGGRDWVPEFRPGHVGTSAMRAVPDSGLRIESDISNNSPRLDYRVDYPSTQSVNVWVRGLGTSFLSDSVWVGIDGDSSNAIRINPPRGGWGWQTANRQLIIPAGEHTINVWMREDGTIVDRLLFTPSSFRPSGDGPAESTGGGDTSDDSPPANNPPNISGTPPSEAVAGRPYSFTPTANDADNQPLAFSVEELPGWLNFDASSGRIWGTPAQSDSGIDRDISITVSDGTDSDSIGPFSITVRTDNLGSATLSWTPPTRNEDGSLLTDLAGYRIYWGPSSGDYPNSETINNPGITTYVVEGLAPGNYEFVSTSFNSSGVESRRSNPAAKRIE